MKLLIDIPEHIYEHAKETTEDSRDEFDAMRAIANGTQQESRSEIPNTCGDVISREAAIRAIEALQRPIMREESNYYQFKFSGMSEALGAVENLPSVTPQPCEDAISRQAVLNLMRGLTRWCIRSEDGKWKNVGLLYDDVMFGIDKLSSVTPQQRTGQWIEVIDETDSLGNKTWHHECSICGSDKSGWGTYKHCPDCGAKMEVE